MRIVANDEVPASFEDARMLEQKAEWKQAAILYELLLKKFPKALNILHRLMIVYRKLKSPSKEITTINKAIKILSSHHERRTKVAPSAATISKKLNLILGFTDKTGKPLVVAPEIAKLEKRKANLLKKK